MRISVEGKDFLYNEGKLVTDRNTEQRLHETHKKERLM